LEVQPIVATRLNGTRLPDRQTNGSRADDAPAAHPGPRRSVAARPGRSGLVLDPLLPFDVWKTLGPRVATYSSASAWWLGDWLAFGQMKYGRRYKEALAQTGLDYKTLRNYAVVARRFEMCRRRDALGFQHHAEVCSLSNSEQDYWLDRAIQHHWSKAELRRRVRAMRRPLVTAGDRSELSVHPAAASERSWREAARRSGLTLDAWIIATLDRAASTVLGDAQRRHGGRRFGA
jgi:hypothetical protein